MSNQIRKINRLRDQHLRKSWQAWLETVKQLPLGRRLTICYQIAPGLKYASRLCVLLAIVVIVLAWILSGALWPELQNGTLLIGGSP